jgi:hypothetical protein
MLRTSAERAQPMRMKMMSAARKARIPGRKLARTRTILWRDWRSADSICCPLMFLRRE